MARRPRPDDEEDDQPTRGGFVQSLRDLAYTPAAKTVGLVGGILAVALIIFTVAILILKPKKPAAADPAPAAKVEQPAPKPVVPIDPRDPERNLPDALMNAGTVAVILAAVSGMLYLAVFFGVGAWVARDADNRGMSGLGWCGFYFAFQIGLRFAMWFALGSIWSVLGFLSLLFEPVYWMGLVIYILARRPGRLVACDRCGLSRLDYTVHCPHCGGHADD